MIEAKAIFQENRSSRPRSSFASMSDATIAVGRIVGSSFNSPRRFAILSAGTSDGVRIGMPVRSPEGLVGRIIDAGALASRVLLVSDRANIVPARLLRNGIPVIAQGRGDGTIDVRPLEVGRNPFKPRRHHHHLGHRRALPAAGADRAGREARRRWRRRSAACRSGIDQLRYRRAAVRACRASRPRRRPATADALMVRAALSPPRRIGQGPRPLAAYRPAADRACGDHCSQRCRSCRPAAGIPTSAISCLSAGGCFAPIRGRPGGPLRWVSSTTCSPVIR